MDLTPFTSEHYYSVYNLFCDSNKRYTRTFEQFVENETKFTEKLDNRAFVVIIDNVCIAYIKTFNHYFYPDRKKALYFVAKDELAGKKLLPFIREVIENSQMQGYKLGTSEFEDQYWKLELLKDLGLAETSRMWRSCLDLETYTLVDVNLDYEILNLAQLMKDDREENIKRINELEEVVWQDVPMVDPRPPMKLDDFIELFEKTPYIEEACFFIRVADQLVAQSTVGVNGDKIALVYMTGSRSEFRKKGLATALKYLSMNKLKELGHEKLNTMNDLQNKPMLSINNKMGFIRDGAAKIMFDEKYC